MDSRLRFLFRKGMIEVILYLDKVGKARYYALYKQDFVVSRQTFASILKKLESEGIVKRRIIEARPPMVEYSLTRKGKNIARILKELKKHLEE